MSSAFLLKSKVRVCARDIGSPLGLFIGFYSLASTSPCIIGFVVPCLYGCRSYDYCLVFHIAMKVGESTWQILDPHNSLSLASIPPSLALLLASSASASASTHCLLVVPCLYGCRLYDCCPDFHLSRRWESMFLILESLWSFLLAFIPPLLALLQQLGSLPLFALCLCGSYDCCRDFHMAKRSESMCTIFNPHVAFLLAFSPPLLASSPLPLFAQCCVTCIIVVEIFTWCEGGMVWASLLSLLQIAPILPREMSSQFRILVVDFIHCSKVPRRQFQFD